MTRAFSTLNPQEALHVAIFIEERNADIYQRFADMFTEFRDPESLEIASAFWDMSVEEKRHSSQLQSRYQDRYGNAGCALTAVELGKSIARERALKVALDAERSAQDFYRQLVEQTEDGELRRLYIELSTMEDGHVIYLQGELATSAVARDQEVN